ncbi:MAG: hypothetical protein H6828_00015 [Planctomycetes bacterium]|nr:hypothetical protein [Planctomycetota bacterium]
MSEVTLGKAAWRPRSWGERLVLVPLLWVAVVGVVAVGTAIFCLGAFHPPSNIAPLFAFLFGVCAAPIALVPGLCAGLARWTFATNRVLLALAAVATAVATVVVFWPQPRAVGTLVEAEVVAVHDPFERAVDPDAARAAFERDRGVVLEVRVVRRWELRGSAPWHLDEPRRAAAVPVETPALTVFARFAGTLPWRYERQPRRALYALRGAEDADELARLLALDVLDPASPAQRALVGR